MKMTKMTSKVVLQTFILFMLVSIALVACTQFDWLNPRSPLPAPTTPPTDSTSATSCPVTEPLWIKPPDDPAVLNPPEYGYYYVNPDHSIWASAWWTGEEENLLRATEEGIKMGWFRPAGAALEITGHRLDGQSLPLDVDVPCCYPTRFQATGLFFPEPGCWEIKAKAEESVLTFIVKVYP